MSVSEMNLSWSTASAQLSSKTLESSTFLTSVSKDGKKVIIRRKPKCLSAKISGMRFPGWKEPKPLRSRCGSASYETAPKSTSGQRSAPKIRDSKENSAVSRSLRSDQMKDQHEVKQIINRLSQPTASSKVKSSVNRPREAAVDMNWYSWAKMSVYKDYQGVIYGTNGTLKKPVRYRDK